jgi:catechol 2,3-dioxygenase-like lactoylglutathione lyase family enzyme
MWGKPPISIPESFSLKVRNLDLAEEWFQAKLGSKIRSTDPDADVRNVSLQFSKDDEALTLEEASSTDGPALGISRDAPPLFYAAKLENAHTWLLERGVAAGPIETDSGGNRLFRFQDLEGNRLEVCQEL